MVNVSIFNPSTVYGSLFVLTVQCTNFEGLDKGSFPAQVALQAEAADRSHCPLPYAEGNFEH